MGRHHADDHDPALERWQQIAQPLRDDDGVGLVPACGQPRRGPDIVLGAERADEDVGIVVIRPA